MLLDQQHLEAHVAAHRTELAAALRHAAAVADATARPTHPVRARLTTAGRNLASLHGHLRWRHLHPIWVRHPIAT